MRHREPAICIRTHDYSETSQVVYFMTRGQGLVRLLAKGTKRPKSKSGGMIDLLAEGDLLYTQKDPETLGTLMEFHETVSHAVLRRDARRLNAALFLIELTGEMLAPADPFPDAYQLLHRTLERLGEPDAPQDAVLAWFQWRMLRLVGLLGGLDACVGCGAPVAELPARRTEKFRLEDGALAGLAALAAAEAGHKVNLPDVQARSANRLLAYHISHQLGKPLKLARYAIPGPTTER